MLFDKVNKTTSNLCDNSESRYYDYEILKKVSFLK